MPLLLVSIFPLRIAHSSIRHHHYLIRSSPSTILVIDLDGDGKLEIIIGTAVGFIYLIDHKGTVVRTGQFPITMDSIFAQIVVEDVNGDGELGK